VTLLGAGGKQVRRVVTDGSYASASDPRVVFGLGDGDEELVAVQVEGPDGRRRLLTGVPRNRALTLDLAHREGS
jgi:hypothetical protein